MPAAMTILSDPLFVPTLDTGTALRQSYNVVCVAVDECAVVVNSVIARG
jgi:hypothetical protein